MKHLKIVLVAFIIFNFQTCKKEIPVEEIPEENFVDQEELYEFGYNLNNFTVVRDTIRRGDSFGQILERNNIGYPKIHEIVEKSKDTFDIRKLKAGKPYTLLCTKDELKEPQAFIYEPYNTEYVVIEFCDSILAYRAYGT